MLQWPAWFHHYFNITKKTEIKCCCFRVTASCLCQKGNCSSSAMLTPGNIDFRAVLRNFLLLLDKGAISGSREPKIFPPQLEIHWAQISLTVSPRSFSGESLPACRCPSRVLGLSLFEGGEFVEGVPEEGWLPLGFCQGKNLLLRDAGGHSDVALMDRMQALVWGRHRTPVIADTCERNSFKKAYRVS